MATLDITVAEEKELSFGDVEDNQFFTDDGGYLCQKVNSCEYNGLADRDGNLHAWTNFEIPKNKPIKKIHNIDRIKF